MFEGEFISLASLSPQSICNGWGELSSEVQTGSQMEPVVCGFHVKCDKALTRNDASTLVL